MNDLNAQQIVLLTLLVSFITSIATGIVTVSLLEQAPEPVTQTINRVVEKTVERIIEVDEKTNEPQERIVETIIVKEEDLTVEAVDKNIRSLARIIRKDGDLETFVAIGIITNENGRLITSSSAINQASQYVAQYPDSNKFNLSIISTDTNYAVLEIAPDQNPPSFRKVVIGKSQNLKLGQSIIAISGQTSNAVTTGIVTGLETATRPLTEEEVVAGVVPQEEITTINTSVDSSKIVVGAFLVNLQGELVGFKKDVTTNLNSFSSSAQLESFINSLASSANTALNSN